MGDPIYDAPKTQEWYTPAEYVDAVRDLFGGVVWLDPATTRRANDRAGGVSARYILTREQDGLSVPWHSESFDAGVVADWNVFLNPPYGRRDGNSGPYNTPLWIEKLVREYCLGNVAQAVLLVNANTGAKWFKTLFNCPLVFVDHRIAFIDSVTLEEQTQPRYYNVFAYLGSNAYGFYHHFEEFGSYVGPRAYGFKYPQAPHGARHGFPTDLFVDYVSCVRCWVCGAPRSVALVDEKRTARRCFRCGLEPEVIADD